MPSNFALPLSSPFDGPSLVYLSHLSSVLDPDETDFTPFNTQAIFTISPEAGEEDRKIVAMTHGDYEVTGGMITCTLFPDVLVALIKKFKADDWPVPKVFIYGPVDREDGPIDVQPGELIGNLDGDIFTLQIRDIYGYLMNPYFTLRQLHRYHFFNLDPTWPFPLTRVNIPTRQQLVGRESTLTEPYMELKGGSLQTVLFNPTGDIPYNLFSFVTNDIIDISILNANPAHPLRMEIREGENAMYQPDRRQRIFNDMQEFLFVPQEHLIPFHKAYDSIKATDAHPVRGDRDGRNGTNQEGLPLEYRIEAFVNNVSLGEAEITQDMKDLVRQEYIFHSEPFQNRAINSQIQKRILELPTRDRVQPIRFKSNHFREDIFKDKSNYSGWMINVDKVIHIAEYMRRKFTEQVLTLMDVGPLPVPALIKNFDLKINSAWRNPERNEHVGGVQNSDHQFGRAADLASLHSKTKSTDAGDALPNPDNVAVHYALFQAGKVFLQDMISINGANKCQSLQVILERSTAPLLFYTVNTAGVISLVKGSAYEGYANQLPTGTEVEKITPVALWASHVHVGWDSEMEGTEMELPPVPSYADMNVVPLLPFMNVIVVATVAADVPSSQQLPFWHVAETLKAYLDNLPAAVQTLIVEVSDPVEMLDAIGAINPYCRINYFYYIGHTFQHGVTLKQVMNEVIDPGLLASIQQLYGADIRVGNDALTQFRLNQFVVANLRFMPQPLVNTLRSVFRKAEGIFMLGCNAGNENDTFSQEFSSIIGQSVFGAGRFSKVFSFDDAGFQPANLGRYDPVDPLKKYLLVTGPGPGADSVNIELISYYRDLLKLTLPDPAYDKTKLQTVEEPIDLQEP